MRRCALYTIEELDFLLNTIREGKKLGAGRTKLHQAREAVLQMNLTTSVYEGMALPRNWRSQQRDFVTQYVRETGWRLPEAAPRRGEAINHVPARNFPLVRGRPKYLSDALTQLCGTV